ncbi:DUF411 domain-containing protein [Dechloromonas sp. CZR5]|uniref:DUF411 domain-containing protein n=1 Tax=Dechloromonas sp. CZR5 TaxID=2608630 RepID=UPI001CC36ECC|nr:DUF411 domain-containing protein [Dechloromonas sp. CZR5]
MTNILHSHYANGANAINRLFLPFATLALLGVSSAAVSAAEVIDVYRSPSCGCCGNWIDYMKNASFEVRTHVVMDVPQARKHQGMPDHFGSCHTAKVGGYAVEGHVPAADVQRLLKEKPKAIGIAVPSMPPGSPGMESAKPVPYRTLLVLAAGESTIFAKH